jgi:hypothetical protein
VRPNILVPLAVLGGLAALVATAGDAAARLAYLEALVWPVCVILAGWWLRSPIRDRLVHLRQIAGWGIEARFAGDEAGPTDAEIAAAINRAVDAAAGPPRGNGRGFSGRTAR